MGSTRKSQDLDKSIDIEEQNQEKEKKKLDDEKSKKDSALKKLSTQEKDLKKQIDKKKKDAVSLKNKIQAIIAEEIKKEKQRAAEEAAKKEAEAKKAAEKANTTTGTTTTPQTPVQTKEKPAEQINLGLTPEMQLISKNFSGNKGKLPWPVERGTITERFGTHPHPVLKDVMVENNGIDIATADGSLVRSIFDGEVVNVIFNPSFQKGVIIKHGEYYSVYTNLSDVTVKAGDKVTTKQKIGTAWEDPEEGKTEVHLEIWKGTVILDPALWISK